MSIPFSFSKASIGTSVLFGGSINQLSFTEDFSFSIGGTSAFLTILLASCKSDNVDVFLERFKAEGITAEDCSFWGDEFEIEEDLFNEEINDDFVEDAENTEEAVEDFDAEDIEE